MGYLKYKLAKLTKAKIPLLSFGYLPTEVQAKPAEPTEDIKDALQLHRPLGPALHQLYSLRPQTLAFSLCDSPVGLLAALLDVIHTREPSHEALTSRSVSPFLSLVELEMQEANRGYAGVMVDIQEEDEEVCSTSTVRPAQTPGPGQGDAESRSYIWSPTEILNFTMLQWLPGPEAVCICALSYTLIWEAALKGL